VNKAAEYVQFFFLFLQFVTSYAGFAMNQYPEDIVASLNSYKLSVLSSVFFLPFGTRGLFEEPASLNGFWTTLITASVIVCLLSISGIVATGRKLRSNLVREIMEK
jgi:Na+/pantothenate symporter